MRNSLATAIAAALCAASAASVFAPASATTPTPATRKLLVPADAPMPGAGARLLQDYGSFALYDIAGTQATAGSAIVASDVLRFTAHPFDTRDGTPAAPAPFSLQAPASASLQVVQFVGPVRKTWLDALAARGIVPVQYVADHGYLVWADAQAQTRLARLRDTTNWLQYAAPYYGFLKVDPRLQQRLDANTASNDEVDVTVQVYRHAGVDATHRFVQERALLPPARQAPLGAGTSDVRWTPILAFENASLRVRVADVAAIAERSDVTFVGETPAFKLMDEKQDVILAGDFAPTPASVGYLQFLLDRGFSRDPGAYPIVDLTDSTIDEGGSGVTVLNTADVKLHVDGDVAQPSRVAYFHNCSSTPDAQVGAIDGHGSLNAGIVVGYDQRGGSPYQDASGFQLGLGVNPFGRIGSTAIFVPGFDTSACGGSAQGLIAANAQNGAKISSNSWGANPPPLTYDAVDQAYDAGVRDADATRAGNQEMIYVVAAANSGPNAATISSPAAGKNVITVGASENVRPDWTDGCGAGPSDANDANDVARFSSRGPAPGNRVKPELIAPGSHVQSGASNYAGYTGEGVCDPYHPAGQTEFAASSGTSHSTPAVSGIASLAYWWIEQGGAGAGAGSVVEVGGARAPSPALMKAWLMAHPSYLTGVDANDDLPSNTQGFGMPNLRDMFDATPKIVLDQSDLVTASGETRSYIWGVADPARPLRVALAYTDAPGALGTSPQVNDLDLAVAVGGQAYLGNHFDHQWSTTGGVPDALDNYEAVFLPPGRSGEVAVTVLARNIAGDATNSGTGPNQDYALVCSNCRTVSTFTLAAAQPSLQVCAGSATGTTVHVGQVGGFSDPVAFSASGNPAATTVTFDPNPVVAPNDVAMHVVAQASAAAGTYAMTATGSAASITKSIGFEFGVYDAAPAVPSLDGPADGGTDVPLQPTLAWQATAQGYRYLVQVATDAAFTHVVASTETLQTAWTIEEPQMLASSTRYWWRVIARNACGDSVPVVAADAIFVDGFDPAAVVVGARQFVTVARAGDCAVDVAPTIVFDDGMEQGGSAWTHDAAAGSVDGWVLGDVAHRGANAWQAGAPPAGAVNDQWLVSPTIVLPTGLSPLNLSFWNQQSLKTGAGGGCQDGALLEISSNGGTSWTQMPSSVLLTTPYDGAISGSFGNPLGNRQGWCGDPQPYTDSVVDLSAYAGQSVKFRFRLGHDRFAHRSGANWAIDDVVVKGCAP